MKKIFFFFFSRNYNLLPKQECLSGTKVCLSVAALVFLISFEPSRGTVRSEHLKTYQNYTDTLGSNFHYFFPNIELYIIMR